jgi:hypothetical protein
VRCVTAQGGESISCQNTMLGFHTHELPAIFATYGCPTSAASRMAAKYAPTNIVSAVSTLVQKVAKSVNALGSGMVNVVVKVWRPKTPGPECALLPLPGWPVGR